MILPGETEAGGDATMPRGGPGAHRDDDRQCRERASRAASPSSDRRPSCLENPRPKDGILTNGERRLSFQAEPEQFQPLLKSANLSKLRPHEAGDRVHREKRE
jgi:hypothetical protein